MSPLVRRVCPGYTAHDVVHRLQGTRVLSRELILGDTSLMPLPDLTNLRPGKRREPMTLSPITLTVAHAVRSRVLRSRTPVNLGQPVVSLASRAVKGLLSLGTRLVERLKYKMVHERCAAGPVSTVVKVDFQIAVLPQPGAQQVASPDTLRSLPRQGAHAPEIAYLVQALPVEDRLPLFHAQLNNTGREVYS